MHDLTAGDYSFVQDNSYGPDRFIIHFSQPSIGLEKPQQQAVAYAFANEEGLNVELGILHNATVEVYNLAGQLVERGEDLNGRVTFGVENGGVYILKVTADNFTESFKVIR